MPTKTGHKVKEAAGFKPQESSTSDSAVERQTKFSTQLKLIEIPSTEFFPMWQSHMDSLLQHGLSYTTASVWEFVLADCRLQYIDLLKLDGAVEVEFFSFDEDDTFLAVPCECSEEITWNVNNLGWVKIPTYLNQEAHRIALSNEWWVGLRTSFNASIQCNIPSKCVYQAVPWAVHFFSPRGCTHESDSHLQHSRGPSSHFQ